MVAPKPFKAVSSCKCSQRNMVIVLLLGILRLLLLWYFDSDSLTLVSLDATSTVTNITFDRNIVSAGQTNNNPMASSSFGGTIQVVFEKDLLVQTNESALPKFEYFTPSSAYSAYSQQSDCTLSSTEQVSFTLTTQLSLDRIWIMKHQCERWPSPLPISIAVYLPPSTTNNNNYTENQSYQPQEYIQRLLQDTLQCDMSRMYVTILIGYHNQEQYPVNTLRNLALQAVVDHTSHAVYIDSDFLISEGLYQELMATAPFVVNDPKMAIVIPAFDYIPNCHIQTQAQALECLQADWDNQRIPKTQNDLLALLDIPNKNQLPRIERGFQSIHGQNRYHGTTMYKTWIHNQSTPIIIPCIKHPTYEPYLAVRMCPNVLPKFPELFKGWGYNKITWIRILLKKMGYQLLQLPHAFVLHLPHEMSVARKSSPDGHPPEFDVYLNWLANDVSNHPNHLPNCVDWKKEHGPLQPL